jgi:hypothetical protein
MKKLAWLTFSLLLLLWAIMVRETRVFEVYCSILNG